MTEISEKFTGKTEPEPEVTYEAAIKPYEDQIKALSSKIMNDCEEAKLNQWAILETLEKVKIKVEDSLGTTVDPGNVDVEKEDQKLKYLYWEIQENRCIARDVSSIINSIGYKFRNYNLNQIWDIVEANEHYW